jgi:hypothetical protein
MRHGGDVEEFMIVTVGILLGVLVSGCRSVVLCVHASVRCREEVSCLVLE